jgi:hypothetical protein
MSNYIVCGWYTPDYAHWLPALYTSLECVRAPHDFVEVPKDARSWERNTLRKAHEVKLAMERHPGKTIIFLDVDCRVVSQLGFLEDIPGDVGLNMKCRMRANSFPKVWWRSNIMVVKPTYFARQFINNWISATADARMFSTDQHTLALAMRRTEGLSVTNISGSLIQHHSASLKLRTPRFITILAGLMPWRASRLGGKSSASDTSADAIPCAGQRPAGRQSCR